MSLVIFLFGAAAGVAAWLTPNTYRASIVVSAVTNTPGSGGGGGLGSMVSQFSGLASLAGLAIGGDSKKFESVAVLQSEALTEEYIRDNKLLPVLYPKLWDPVGKRWKVTDPKKAPTVWKATQRFKHSIANVSTDTKTGLVTLTITWTDADLAAKWANDLVSKTNDHLRSKAIVESDRNIAYLNTEVVKTDVVGVKTAIFSVLQNEISKEMLARGSDEYALKVVDPAVAPEVPYSPQPVMWVLIGIFSGLLVCVIAAFVHVAWRKTS
jgi:uncharacterized protein involved in exopolysaccharide biosynthesis